jgi:hypothetical protein
MATINRSLEEKQTLSGQPSRFLYDLTEHTPLSIVDRAWCKQLNAPFTNSGWKTQSMRYPNG